jgi:uncharacterized membrane protein YedE/YeeE
MNWISEPWPWYVTGPLIGLVVPLLLYFGNKQFGISASFKDACAACLPIKPRYFQYDWKASVWRFWFVGGLVLGAVLVAVFAANPNSVAINPQTTAWLNELGVNNTTGLVPAQIFSWSAFSSPLGWVFIVGGGFLVGFGTRYANGCTSGHAIMGLSRGRKGSLIAVMGFFIGGLITTWLILPSLLKMWL